jgi:hypothetical protein
MKNLVTKVAMLPFEEDAAGSKEAVLDGTGHGEAAEGPAS